MENNKNILPYTITIYGELKTKSNEFEKMQEELREVDAQFLINHGNAMFIEADRDEYDRINKESKDNQTSRINVKLEDIKLIEVTVTKDNIKQQDIECVNKALAHLRKDIKNSQNKLKISFLRKDNKQKIYEIVEVRNYIKKLFEENQDLFYFLTEESANSQKILACIANITTIRDKDGRKIIQKLELPKEITEKIIESIITAADYDKEKAKEKVLNLLTVEWED